MATRSIWTGVAVDLRRSARPAIVFTGIAVALFLLIGGAAVGVVYLITERSRPQGPTAPQIPLSQMTSGMLQAFECVRVGPKSCDQYDNATQYLTQATPGSGLTYTPLTDDAPGRPSAEGTRTVALRDLSRAQWRVVAASVTRDGQATNLSVPPNAVQVPKVDTATYYVPGAAGQPAGNGTMIFTVGKESVVLKSVTYG